jgi:hypothetical protein
MSSWIGRCFDYFTNKGSQKKNDQNKKNNKQKPTLQPAQYSVSQSQQQSSGSVNHEEIFLLKSDPHLCAKTFLSSDAPSLTDFRSKSHSTCSTVLIHDDECVICLEEFSSENPQVSTLCQCGENRSKFHYPCLLMWMQKKPVCPTCDQTLFYEVSTSTNS